MQTSIIQQRLLAYSQWKTRASQTLSELESWLESGGQATGESRNCIQQAFDILDKDRLTIAFVAEPARGKTEMINAIFFAEYGQRLLPSSADETTSCPTELLWDQARNEAYLRLLPIETRARNLSIGQLKRDPKQWVHYLLRVQEPEQMVSTLREILQTRKVSMVEATRLGLSTSKSKSEEGQHTDQVEIPKWRHAIVSLPHPFFKQGLVILDTPARRTLGSESELTESMLSAAQTILFVLAVDTSVTLDDLEVWQHYLKGFQAEHRQKVVVALNKIDLLWHQHRETQETESRLAEERARAANALGISEALVLPVSAQDALLAKTSGDTNLLIRSSMPALELHLSRRMIETKHRVLTDALDKAVGPLIEGSGQRISSRISQAKAQLDELEQLHAKSNAVVDHLLKRTHDEQDIYLKGVQQFQASRASLLEETSTARRALDRDNLVSLVDGALREMMHSWTTRGLSNLMKGLFDELQRTMHVLSSDCERIRKNVQLTYQRFNEDFGFDLMPPKVFIATEFRVEIELLHQEVEVFRTRSSTQLAEQSSVIKRFQQQMVSRALVLFDQLRAAYDDWIRDTLQPLSEQIQEHKLMMEKRLENLRRISSSNDSLQTRIDDLRKHHIELSHKLTALRNIHNVLEYDPSVEERGNGKPRLVAGEG